MSHDSNQNTDPLYKPFQRELSPLDLLEQQSWRLQNAEPSPQNEDSARARQHPSRTGSISSVASLAILDSFRISNLPFAYQPDALPGVAGHLNTNSPESTTTSTSTPTSASTPTSTPTSTSTPTTPTSTPSTAAAAKAVARGGPAPPRYIHPRNQRVPQSTPANVSRFVQQLKSKLPVGRSNVEPALATKSKLPAGRFNAEPALATKSASRLGGLSRVQSDDQTPTPTSSSSSSTPASSSTVLNTPVKSPKSPASPRSSASFNSNQSTPDLSVDVLGSSGFGIFSKLDPQAVSSNSSASSTSSHQSTDRTLDPHSYIDPSYGPAALFSAANISQSVEKSSSSPSLSSPTVQRKLSKKYARNKELPAIPIKSSTHTRGNSDGNNPADSRPRPDHQRRSSDISVMNVRPADSKQLLSDLSLTDVVAKGNQYHSVGDLRQAAYHWQYAALRGEITAMLLYGLAVRHGWGLKQNPKEAVDWLRKAVAELTVDKDRHGILDEDDGEQPAPSSSLQAIHQATGVGGSIKRSQIGFALYELGMSYLKSWGTSKDEDMALRSFELAGNFGDTDALFAAAEMYTRNGPNGRKKDLARAAELYRKAGELGANMTGFSWIYKDKYMPKKDKDKEKERLRLEKEKDKESKRLERERERENREREKKNRKTKKGTKS